MAMLVKSKISENVCVTCTMVPGLSGLCPGYTGIRRYPWQIYHNPLQWRHNGRDGVSNHRRLECLLKRLFRRSLTHWGRVTHICVSRVTTTGSDNGLSPGRRQAIIWTSAGILLIVPLRINFSENSVEILAVSFMKMQMKVSSGKWRPFCLGLNM